MKFLNKLLYGDCIRLMKKIPDKSVEMVLTDIPYNECNEKYYVDNTIKGDTFTGYGRNRNFLKGDADKLTFNLNIFIKECCRICFGSIYIFCGFTQISCLISQMKKHKLRTRLCIWEKINGTPINGDKFWESKIEACAFGRFPKAIFNEHCASPVWRFSIEINKIHNTQKSLKLFKYLINTSSREGQTILDPCAGSGTVAVASLLSNRNYICIENNLNAYKVAKLRIEVTKERIK